MSDRFQRGVTASIVNRTDGKKRKRAKVVAWWKKKKKVAQVKVELKIWNLPPSQKSGRLCDSQKWTGKRRIRAGHSTRKRRERSGNGTVHGSRLLPLFRFNHDTFHDVSGKKIKDKNCFSLILSNRLDRSKKKEKGRQVRDYAVS